MRHLLFTLLLVIWALPSVAQTRIAFLCDLHSSPNNHNSAKLREVVNEINNGDCQIVVVAGDLTNEGSDAELQNVKAILDGLKKPQFVVPGNHEDQWSQSACKRFNDLWGDDRFVTELDGMILVGLNCGPFMKAADGHIKREDLTWLDETLSKHKDKRVISVNHYPIADDLDNYDQYINTLSKYRVAVHLCGHYHTFRHYKGGEIDGLMCRSLDMRNGDYGYTIIEIEGDTLRQWNKPLGGEKELKYTLAIDDSPKKPIKRNDEQYELPEGIEVDLVHSDEASIFTRLGVDATSIYFGNSLGKVKAIDKQSGELRWEYATANSLFSQPSLSKKWVIVPTSDERMLWIDKQSGKLRKEREAKGPYAADGKVVDNVLYQGGYKCFEAWNAKSGKLLWRNEEMTNYCQAAPAITASDITFGAWDTNLYNIDRKSGKTNWSWNNSHSSHLYSPGNCIPVATADRVYIVAPDRAMTCLDRHSGKEIWRVKDYTVRESLGASADLTQAYARTMDGEVIAVDLTTDKYKINWVVDVGFGYEFTPCALIENKGVVYAASRRGVVAAVDATSGELLWRYRFGISALNGFEVDEKGDIYISLYEGKIYRISDKQAKQ